MEFLQNLAISIFLFINSLVGSGDYNAKITPANILSSTTVSTTSKVAMNVASTTMATSTNPSLISSSTVNTNNKPKATSTLSKPITPTKPSIKATTSTTTLPKKQESNNISTTTTSTTTERSQITPIPRNSLVNIICLVPTDSTLKPTSGSGVIIDSRGVILTNAHVALYLMFEDYFQGLGVNCSIRTGSPAKSEYKADLLYMPPAWVNKNKTILSNPNPTGTGENDYAFVQITESIDQIPLPTFPYAPVKIKEPEEGDTVTVSGYPAGFLGGLTIISDLFSASAISKIEKVYTFSDEQTIDLLSVGSSIVAQKGSSGGAVIDKDSNLVGVIVTTTSGATTGERILHAITTGHINRSLLGNAGFDIAGLLTGDINAKKIQFQTTIIPGLAETLLSSQ